MALIGSECGGVEREVLTEKEEDGNETCDKSGLLNSGEAGYSGANSTVDGPSMNFAADPLIPGECSSHSDPTNVENWIDQSSPQPVIPAPIEPYLDPPENFSHVVGRIFRSSFPRVENFEFLKTLKLKSILILIPEQYPEENLQFMRENNIQVLQVGMSGNKEPFVNVSHETITKALEIAINPENHPLLIHCNRGKGALEGYKNGP